MGRERSRLSRGLIGILTIVIAIGLVAYFHSTSKTKAAEKPKVTTALDTHKHKAAKDAASGATPVASAELITSAPQSEVSISPAPLAKPGTSGAGSGVAGTTAGGMGAGGMGAGAALSPATKPTTHPAVASQSKSASVTLSSTPVADGKAKMDAGDLLNARRILNAALLAGSLSDADASEAKSLLNAINATVVFSPKRFADDEFGGTYSVQPGELLTKIAAQHDITWQYLCRVNGLADPKKLRAGATIKVVKGPFHALVEKKKFNMEIWVGGEPYAQGASYVTSFPVGLGRDDSTPDGKWLIQQGNKIKNPTYYSPRGEGVIEAGDPKNPLGQFWMGLVGVDGHAVGKQSYGIHGTIDPDSIGKQASMGCIRMKNEDVAQVFELLVEGKSTVTVRD